MERPFADPAFDADRDTSIPAGETPIRCPHCAQPFSSDRYRTLHLGLAHYDRLAAEDRDAFVEAYRGETDEIRTFRLKVLGLLVLLYFLYLFVWLLVA
ncbi:DUF7410 domain-containing protein [Natronorarus salvus]|uniref:DUF7410 domain-containing protein n=1 Tax=Natronorarus salvus TaxID=3117733 RepID=UPI002F2622F7